MIINLFLLLLLGLKTTIILGYPVDPNKVPVTDISQKFTKDYLLAYDSIDKSIIYYAPKGGRVALMNGQPLLGFASGAGVGYLNAQFEFGVFGSEREKLFDAIENAGYTARPFPYVKTTIQPLTPIDPETGKVICEEFENQATGKIEVDCSANLYTKLSFSRIGPTLGEYVPVTIQLNSFGSLVYKSFLRSGNALQILLNAEYYVAGTGFKAKVTVDYSKLLENYHAYSAFMMGYAQI